MKSHVRRICLALIIALGASARLLAQAPSNDSFSSPATVSGTSFSVTGSNIGATSQAGEPNHAGVSGGNSVWWQWTAPQSGAVTLTTVGSNYDTTLAVYTGSAVNALSLVASNDDAPGAVTSLVTFNATNGVTYRIAVDGFSGATGSIRLNLAFSSSLPPNDNFSSATSLSGTSASVTGTNVGANREVGEPTHAGVGGGLSVWWVWTAPQSGAATINTLGSSFDTVLAVYTGSSVSSLTEVAANDDDADLTSRVSFTATGGTTYRIAVDGYQGAAGSIRLALSLTATSGSAPTITSQPVSQSVNPGATVTFSVAASGTAPLSYQWRLNGVAIPGATASTLTVPNVAAVNAGAYTVVVSNSFGAATSNSATLTVGALTAPPVITSQPQSASVGVGGGALFSVTASSSSAVSYQWRFNNTNISGATSATLALSNVTTANAGTYTVVVSNSAGSVTSNGATLTVTAVTPPTITSQPASQNVTAGATASFAVSVSSSVAVSYQWRFNGVNISGATSATLTLNNVQQASAGAYSVVVSNSAGSVTSGNATLTVTTVVTPPSIVSSPVSQTASPGGSVTLSVNASGSALSYQWLSSGSAIPGATGPSYTISNLSDANAGFYAVRITNSAGTVTSGYATVVSNASNTRITNVSTRGYIPVGERLTPGIVLRGTGTKTLLIRGIGPTLGDFGLPGVLTDPQFELQQDSGRRPILTNNDWEFGTELGLLTSTTGTVGAFPLRSGARDAAAIATLAPGNYTVGIYGKNTTDSGVVLGEIYDADSLSSPVRLVNVSTRAFVGTGERVLTAGFAIRGAGSKQLLIRAVGPSLTQFQVPGLIADPSFDVVAQAGNVVIAGNDNWNGAGAIASAAAAAGAFPLNSNLDAAAIVRLPPGVNTVQVRSAGGATGVGLVEIYDLDP